MTGTLAFDKFQLIGNEIIQFTKSEDPDKVYQWSDSKGKKYGVNNLPPILVTEHGYAHPKWVGKTRDDFEGKVVNDITCRANKYMRKVLAELKGKKEKEADELKKEAKKVKREAKKEAKKAANVSNIASATAAAATATAIPPTPLSTAVAATPATTTTKAVAVIAATPFATATVDAASAPASINNHDIIQAFLPLLHNQQQLIANTIHNQEQHAADQLQHAADQLQQAANQQEMMSHFHNQQLLNSTTIKDNTLAIEETKEDLADHKLDTSREMKQMREEFIDSLKKKPAESSANHDNNPRKLLGSFDAAPEDAYGPPAADDAADDAVTGGTPRARGGGDSATVDKEVTEENRNSDPLKELVPHNACSSPDAAALAGGFTTTVDKEVTEENRNYDAGTGDTPTGDPPVTAVDDAVTGDTPRARGCGGSTTVDKEGTEEKTGNDDPLEKLVSHNACSSPDAAVRGGDGGGFTTVDKDVAEEETCNDDDPPTGDPPVAAADDAGTGDTPRARGGGGGSTTIDKEGPEENRNYDTGTGGTPTYGPPVPAADDAGTGDTPRSEGIKATPAPAPTTKTQENSMSSDDDEDAEYLAYVASYVGEEIQQKGEENEYERTNEDINNNNAQTRVEEVGDGTGSKSIGVSDGNNSRGGGGSTTVDKEGTEKKTGNGNDNAGNNFIVTNKRRVSLGGNDDDNNTSNDSSSTAAPAGVPTLSSIGGPPRKKLQGEDGSTIHYFAEEETETYNDNDDDDDDDIFLEDGSQEESPVADAHAGIQDLPIESQKQKARWLSLGSIGWSFTLGIAIIFIIVGGGCCRFLEPNDIRNSINGFISIILNGIMNIQKIGINNSNNVLSSKFYLYLYNNLFGTNENTPSFEEAEETQCFLDSDFDLGSEVFFGRN